MIKFHPPSVVGPYDLISSFDFALAWPEPPARDPGEADDAYEARLKAEFAPKRDEFKRLLSIARDTGQFGPVLKAGDQPTRFRVRQMPPKIAVQWERVVAKMSTLETMALAIRCVLIGAENWIPGFSVGRSVEHLDLDGRPSGLGPVAPFDVIESFYVAAKGEDAEALIVDLGVQILNRRGATSGN